MPAPEDGKRLVGDFSNMVINPNQIRWKPFPLASGSVDFIQGLTTIAGSGSAEGKSGLAIHIYAFNRDMGNRVFCNSDGDFIIVPQLNTLLIRTEFGKMIVAPAEFCVIPRGIKYQVSSPNGGDARGYICEIFNGHPRLPDLGPIGINNLSFSHTLSLFIMFDLPRSLTFFLSLCMSLFSLSDFV